MGVAQSTTCTVCAKIPTAASDDAFGLTGIIPVACPFPDVAVHVEQTPRIGRKATNRYGAILGIESGLFSRQLVTEAESRSCSSTARVFPFGFRRKAKSGDMIELV